MKALDNLVGIKKLKEEPPDTEEIKRMVSSAEAGLKDALVEGISENGKFSLTYIAAHSLSLAALRYHGYRSENRYIVFQCLQHTLGWDAAKWRVLAKCHDRRNVAEYEGDLDIDRQLLEEFVILTQQLLKDVKALTDS